jgi:hypothetical protein
MAIDPSGPTATGSDGISSNFAGQKNATIGPTIAAKPVAASNGLISFMKPLLGSDVFSFAMDLSTGLCGL